MSDDEGRNDAPEPEPGPAAETGDDIPTRDPEAPGTGAFGGGDDADPPEPNEPA
jgi:hypothetical protein